MPSWVEPPSQHDSKQQLWDYLRSDIWGFIFAAITLDWGSYDIYWNLIGWDLDHLWANVEDFATAAVEGLDEWIEETIYWVRRDISDVWDRATDAWYGLGDAVTSWGYTATTWAIEMRDQAIGTLRPTVEEAISLATRAWDWVWEKGGVVWDWVSGKGGIVWDWIWGKGSTVWDWISGKGDIVWDWINERGAIIEFWWNETSPVIDSWIETYQEFYQDLFDNYRDDIGDLFDDPGNWIAERLAGSVEYLLELVVTLYW